jgi:pilus assembly protein CpaB
VENIMSSKVFRTRQGTILLGVVAAVLAAIALIVYLNQYRSSVNKGAVPVTVLVAKKNIPQNTSGEVITSSGLYTTRRVAKDQATGAITNTSELTGKFATTTINAGDQLTSADFASGSNSVSTDLARGQRAVVVPLDSPSQVGDQIAAGDRVDVYAAINVTTANGATNPVVREILQNMYVLNTNSDGNVTLRATPPEAGKLIFAAENEKIWLTLRPAIGSVSKPPLITSNTLLGR